MSSIHSMLPVSTQRDTPYGNIFELVFVYRLLYNDRREKI